MEYMCVGPEYWNKCDMLQRRKYQPQRAMYS